MLTKYLALVTVFLWCANSPSIAFTIMFPYRNLRIGPPTSTNRPTNISTNSSVCFQEPTTVLPQMQKVKCVPLSNDLYFYNQETDHCELYTSKPCVMPESHENAFPDRESCEQACTKNKENLPVTKVRVK